MTKIGIDLDDTLYDFGSEVREAFFEMAIEYENKELLKGAYSGYYEWRELSDVFSWDIVSDAIERVHKATLHQQPYKNSVRVVNRLAERHEIKYVTSRYEKYHDETCDWLKQCGFPTGEVICSDHEKAKHLWDCQFLLDDRPKTIVEFVTDFTWKNTYGSKNPEKQRKAFGIWTTYNRNLTDIKGIYLAPTWRGIEFYLERKKIL